MVTNLTPGDKLAITIAQGPRCVVVFSTGSTEIGDVRRYGRGPDGRELWILATPTSEHFFGIDELRDVAPAARTS